MLEAACTSAPAASCAASSASWSDGGPVEVGGDGLLLVVEPLEQQLQRLVRPGVSRPNSEPGAPGRAAASR